MYQRITPIDNKLKSEFVNVMSVDLAKKLLNVFLPPEYREDEDTNIEENFPEESPAVEMPQASTAPSQDIDITPAVSTPQATAAAIPQVTRSRLSVMLLISAFATYCKTIQHQASQAFNMQMQRV